MAELPAPDPTPAAAGADRTIPAVPVCGDPSADRPAGEHSGSTSAAASAIPIPLVGETPATAAAASTLRAFPAALARSGTAALDAGPVAPFSGADAAAAQAEAVPPPPPQQPSSTQQPSPPEQPSTPEQPSSPKQPSPAATAGPLPLPEAAQLPVVDLIGLRFSLQHLRLVGYGLLAVWGSEIINLLTSPRLVEIGTRLHYISQFLDLSPILLVAIGLIAFQGGLRRRPLEQLLLPWLLALLPLLSAFHFFLAPVSVANAVTLVQKQQQISLDQIETIDRQLDRAAEILRGSDSIDALLSGLQRIPGLQVRVPPSASVTDARQVVRRSLERERERLRERIAANVSSSREAFLRRAITNALLALVVGLLLWGLHHGAMQEMEQAIPFLDWVLVEGETTQQPEMLHGLLRFQRACVALGWFSLLERSLRLVRRVVRRPSREELAQEEEQLAQRAQAASSPVYAAPPPRRPGLFSAPLPLLSSLGGAGLPPDPAATVIGSSRPDRPGETSSLSDTDPSAANERDPLSGWLAGSREGEQRREQMRRQRDLERYRALRLRIERQGLDPFAAFGSAAPEPEAQEFRETFSSDQPSAPGRRAPDVGCEPSLPPQQRRRLERDQQRAREALRRMAHSEDLGWGAEIDPDGDERELEQELAEELDRQRYLHQSPEGDPAMPRPRRGLWAWFLSHL